MKTLMTKTLLAVAVTAAVGFASNSAVAVVFPDFTVDATGYGAPATFVADKITGNYAEWISVNTTGGFDVSILWNAGQFVANDGATALPAGGPSGTGLGNTYGMYALFQGSGVLTSFGSTTNFTLTPGGSLALYLDPNLNTGFVDPVAVQGQNPWTTTNSGDDLLIAAGAGLSGSGTLNTSCGGINCGSFGQATSFNLQNPNGTSFFILPVPFYDVSFQSGQFNNFTPTGTQKINGSMDAVFVPEPESLALLGIGLLGMAMARRNRKQA